LTQSAATTSTFVTMPFVTFGATIATVRSAMFYS
jgi:hypothetical protein